MAECRGCFGRGGKYEASISPKHQYQYLDNASNLEIREGDTANWYTTRHTINKTQD